MPDEFVDPFEGLKPDGEKDERLPKEIVESVPGGVPLEPEVREVHIPPEDEPPHDEDDDVFTNWSPPVSPSEVPHPVDDPWEKLHPVKRMHLRMQAHLPAYDYPRCEDEYVTRELAVTKDQMDRGLLKEVIDDREGPGKGKGRMWRSERYLRWRYQEFMKGEVGSL